MSKHTSPRASQARSLMILVVCAVCLLLVGAAAQYLLPLSSAGSAASDALPAGEKDVRLSEIMSANSSAFTDDKGNYSDWLEIENAGSQAIDLTAWTLTLSSQEVMPFTFGSQTLEPGEYLLIFADGTSQNTPGYFLHAPYKLPAAGGVTLTLRDRAGREVDSVELPSLEKNQVYARNRHGEWAISSMYTPSLPNAQEYYELVLAERRTAADPIELSEVMVKNATYAMNEYGEYTDWIEIHNTSNRAVSLSGYALSDSSANLRKWIFPDRTLQPGEYLLVYADGRASTGTQLHASFRLSADGESLYLSNPDGQIVDTVAIGALTADQSFSRLSSGEWSSAFVPTPGYENTASGAARLDDAFRAQNSTGLYITEVMASTDSTDVSKESYDWLELYNASSNTIDLSGFGLSDKSSHPRKWQFPQGASIRSGEYMIVFLSGLDGKVDNAYHTSFRLSASGGTTLSLSDASGNILDRLSVPEQYANISYGRVSSLSGFAYFEAPTPCASNVSPAYQGRCETPTFATEGGLFAEGDKVTISLSAPQGQSIYYTLDCTDPTAASTLYTGPFTVSSNTIVRAVAIAPDRISSFVNTQSYFFGLSHTVRVVSLVSDPANLFDYYTGIYERGPNATDKHPYGSMNKGANFWMDWEKAANVEIFSPDGETILSDPCGVKLHGQYSRAEDQKAFKVIARSKYGSHRFEAALFDNRDYTEYQSFVLRASGQDTDKSRMRDSVLSALADGTGVMYQETELCVVYLNGEYWGHYNIRERINTYSICQWEGWSEDVKDDIDLVKANRNAMQGSNQDFADLIEWIKANGVATDANLAYVEERVDVDNYLNYIAVEMFTSNPDLLNVKRYKCDRMDGKWRWILFDLDWAFYHNSNSISRWLNPDGVGTDLKTDNTLFVELMKNPDVQDRFLTILGNLMATNFSTENVIAKIDERYNLLKPEMEMHQARWGLSMATWEKEVERLREYARTRPGLLLGYIQDYYKFSNEEMRRYFGEAMDKAGYTGA